MLNRKVAQRYSDSVRAQSTCRGRAEIGGVYLPSQMDRTPQLLTVRDGRCSEIGWAPESGRCHSVCSLWVPAPNSVHNNLAGSGRSL